MKTAASGYQRPPSRCRLLFSEPLSVCERAQSCKGHQSRAAGNVMCRPPLVPEEEQTEQIHGGSRETLKGGE